MEIKTSKEITVKTIALTNTGCANLTGQAKKDFVKSINNQKWIEAESLIFQLQDWNNIEGDNMDLVIKRIEEMIKNGN